MIGSLALAVWFDMCIFSLTRNGRSVYQVRAGSRRGGRGEEGEVAGVLKSHENWRAVGISSGRKLGRTGLGRPRARGTLLGVCARRIV